MKVILIDGQVVRVEFDYGTRRVDGKLIPRKSVQAQRDYEEFMYEMELHIPATLKVTKRKIADKVTCTIILEADETHKELVYSSSVYMNPGKLNKAKARKFLLTKMLATPIPEDASRPDEFPFDEFSDDEFGEFVRSYNEHDVPLDKREDRTAVWKAYWTTQTGMLLSDKVQDIADTFKALDDVESVQWVRSGVTNTFYVSTSDNDEIVEDKILEIELAMIKKYSGLVLDFHYYEGPLGAKKL
jgi:hypothetical protein